MSQWFQYDLTWNNTDCPWGFKITKLITHNVPLSPLNQGVSEEVVIAKILLKLLICCTPKLLSAEVWFLWSYQFVVLQRCCPPKILSFEVFCFNLCFVNYAWGPWESLDGEPHVSPIEDTTRLLFVCMCDWSFK